MTFIDPPVWIGARRRSRSRRGAVYFAELILVMPVLMIMFLAVVQFGMFFTNLQELSFAARVGAIAASETTVGGAVPASVQTIVEEHLQANGIDTTELCIAIEFSGGSVNNANANCAFCDPSSFTAPSIGTYYRVNVCLPQDALMPNLLQPFGYDITGDDDVVNCATVMQKES